MATKAQKLLIKYMPLNEDEEVINHLEGDAYNLSSNIFLRMLSFIIRVISVILGVSSKVHIYVTNQRVILINLSKVLWFFDGSVSADSYTPRAISSSGYQLSRSLLVFKTHYLKFTSSSAAILIKAKGGMNQVMSMIGNISELADKVSSN